LPRRSGAVGLFIGKPVVRNDFFQLFHGFELVRPDSEVIFAMDKNIVGDSFDRYILNFFRCAHLIPLWLWFFRSL